MGIFSRIFMHDHDKKQEIRNQIDIAEAVKAHMAWKARLQRCLDGTSDEKLDPMLICRDDQCTLGKWIHGPAAQFFVGDEEFNTLRADHAQFHYVAGNVVLKIQQNDRAGAMELFKNGYFHASHKVLYTLTELNKHLQDN